MAVAVATAAPCAWCGASRPLRPAPPERLSPSDAAPLRHIDMRTLPSVSSQDLAAGRTPALPDPAELARHRGALEVVERVHEALQQRLAGGEPAPIDLTALRDTERRLLNQLLGEGEVAAQVVAAGVGETGLQAQESVFAGVWRVLHLQTTPHGAELRRDTVEVGAVPGGLLEAAREDARSMPAPPTARTAGTTNAPSVLQELRDKVRTWRPGDAPHVVNLSLLPLTPDDLACMDAELGVGRVVVLSRGYGSCRIVNTRLPRTWRVTYFNASDLVVLDTLEVATMPDAACAAAQDLEDSAERVREVLAWVRESCPT